MAKKRGTKKLPQHPQRPPGFLEIMGGVAAGSLESGHRRHASIKRLRNILEIAKKQGVGEKHIKEAQQHLENLDLRPQIEEVRGRGGGEKSVFVDKAGYSQICKPAKEITRTVAKTWLENAASGRGKRIFSDMLSRDLIDVRAGKVGEFSAMYKPDEKRLTFIIPKSKIEEIIQLAHQAPQQANLALLGDTLCAGHHEISESLSIIGSGAEKENDIVHHTLGLLGQAIGPTFPHPELGHKTGADWKVVGDFGASSMPDSEGKADAKRIRDFEKKIKSGGAIKPRELVELFISHSKTYAPNSFEDLRSAQLAHRLFTKIGAMDKRSRDAAIKHLYSGKIDTAAGFEEFIKNWGN